MNLVHMHPYMRKIIGSFSQLNVKCKLHDNFYSEGFAASSAANSTGAVQAAAATRDTLAAFNL
jgi:hypothetical protein